MFVFVGFLTVIVAFVWGLVDAYQGARRWNARHGMISWTTAATTGLRTRRG